MEPLIKTKRKVSVFVPYRKMGDTFEYFLQKRDAHAARHPNLFSLFGGGIEVAETSEQACLREVEEELAYVPKRMQYFTELVAPYAIFHVYIEEVGSDFESRITVLEGEFGTFLSLAAVDNSPQVSDIAQMTVRGMDTYLTA